MAERWALYWHWPSGTHRTGRVGSLNAKHCVIQHSPSSSTLTDRKHVYAVFPSEGSAKQALTHIGALKAEYFNRAERLQERYQKRARSQARKMAREAQQPPALEGKP